MSNTRLTVIVRKDLQMTPGLLAAQVSHIADAFIRAKLNGASRSMVCNLFSQEEIAWFKEPYISVLAINTYEELEDIIIKASSPDKDKTSVPFLQCRVWKDVLPAPTFGRPMTFTVGVALGPDDFDKIKLITGDLPLY